MAREVRNGEPDRHDGVRYRAGETTAFRRLLDAGVAHRLREYHQPFVQLDNAPIPKLPQVPKRKGRRPFPMLRAWYDAEVVVIDLQVGIRRETHGTPVQTDEPVGVLDDPGRIVVIPLGRDLDPLISWLRLGE